MVSVKLLLLQSFILIYFNRYYYVIVIFFSVVVVEYVMNECNGIEFEQIVNILDLSYVFDDMIFDEDFVK